MGYYFGMENCKMFGELKSWTYQLRHLVVRREHLDREDPFLDQSSLGHGYLVLPKPCYVDSWSKLWMEAANVDLIQKSQVLLEDLRPAYLPKYRIAAHAAQIWEMGQIQR